LLLLRRGKSRPSRQRKQQINERALVNGGSEALGITFGQFGLRPRVQRYPFARHEQKIQAQSPAAPQTSKEEKNFIAATPKKHLHIQKIKLPLRTN